jgi:glycerophosphoryl diester phosphodiesterase
MAFTIWDGDEEVPVGSTSVWDGTAEVPADAYMMPFGYNDAASMINSPTTFYAAHRGGSADWPEMSLRAYTNAVAWGAGALEISANRTADGVWVAVHDQTLVRTSPGAPNTPVGDMTWAEVQEWTNSGEPYARLETILDAYGSSHVMFLDPKYGGWDMTGFLDLILDHMPPENVVIKFFHDASTVANAAHARGLLTWGYYYQDSADQIPFTSQYWDFLGMDYQANQDSWDLALATGKKVAGHIIPDAAAAATAITKGASGLVVSGVTLVVPGPVVPIGS